eukprot:3165598-Rhodomonas_salina.2
MLKPPTRRKSNYACSDEVNHVQAKSTAGKFSQPLQAKSTSQVNHAPAPIFSASPPHRERSLCTPGSTIPRS